MEQKSLDIQRGLFLIRYESAENVAHPPTVTISVDAGARDVDLVLHPDADDPVLWSPGASLIVKAQRSARLWVAVEPSEPNGSIAAKVQLTTLSNDPAGTARPPEPAALDLSGFNLLGHVAGIGDVSAGPGKWIAGPAAPSRIEGIAIQWPAAEQVGLCYAVRIGGQRPAATELLAAGAYAGTRGRSLPLVAATLEISGRRARGHQLVVDAIFLGSPQMRVTGQRVVLSGPTGREPLVGLRVDVEAVKRAAAVSEEAAETTKEEAADTPPQATRATPPTGKRTGPVRVFRSGGKGKRPPPG
jgi:hypothetical protein